ncbi:ribbon-helix-helix protein, CopG family [Scytonema hofmannii FACHB-248]|uniref:Ribbon-helix-helix protein, CopG family n=1 Tax=Scytonema hofmannii FACHB-248 TaxID=1842502 RepID=A0ABR8H2T1_9CYAN|nr:ribbon-helix-helix protein, CopG family [Scytonema hofmannii FACHB-248]
MAERGRPRSGREVKGVSLKVNPEAWELFQQLAQAMGLSRSELVEKIATNQIPLLQENTQLTKSLGNLSAS